MNRLKPLPLSLVNILEVMIAVMLGFLLRDLINMAVVLFSMKISSTLLTLILIIPVLILMVKAHYAFRHWLVRKGWLENYKH